MILGDWKLIDQVRGEGFLFDLAQDPRETTNLIDSHPEIVKELRGRLEAWWPVKSK